MKQKCNKVLGNSFEDEFCIMMVSNGFWAHNIASNRSGQPADIISCKNGKSILVDCKVCKSNRFPISRIEENQEQAMTLWKQCGNGDGWFALKLKDDSVYMMSLALLLCGRTRLKGIFEEPEIRTLGIPFEVWIKGVLGWI